MRLHAGTFFWPAPAHQFFERADMMDTAVGTAKKGDAAEAAKNGFLAMMKGEGDVVSGWKNKVQILCCQRPPGRCPGQAASQDGRTGFREILAGCLPGNSASMSKRRKCSSHASPAQSTKWNEQEIGQLVSYRADGP
jgi:hypothetical protein